MAKKVALYLKKLKPLRYWKELLGILIILFAFIFFRDQRKEIEQIMPLIQSCNPYWFIGGLLLTFFFIFMEGYMYVASFKAVGINISLKVALELFLKRNFLSVFLPAGGISSLAYTTTQLRRMNLNKTLIHQTSIVYGYIALFSVFLLAVPALLYSFFQSKQYGNLLIPLLTLGLILAISFYIIYSFRYKTSIYYFIEKKFPKTIFQISNLFSSAVNKRYLALSLLFSVLVEFCGIIHILIAMMALGLPLSFEAAILGYIISTLLMIVSPFLRGLGAVELSMFLIFKKFGYTHEQGIGITILYRFFEFWLPLIFGFISFSMKGTQLLTRIGPAVMIFILGIINIISVLLPPIADRLHLERFYFPAETLAISKLMVLIIGIGLIVSSTYLLKGFRNAFWFASCFCVISLIGHLLKGIDYEESIVAAITLVFLLFNHKEYRVQANNYWVRIGVLTFIFSFIAIVIFETLSFYIIDKRHFGIDFTWRESFIYAMRGFLLFSDAGLEPRTNFGREFLHIIHALGFGCWILFFYTILRSKKYIAANCDQDKRALAKNLMERFGNSSLDYFKISNEKELYFSKFYLGFVSYRVANKYAVVLDEPVCHWTDKEDVIQEFDEYCMKNGLKSIYFRISEDGLLNFQSLKKKKLLIGEEGIVDVQQFSLQGKSRKSLRNGLNYLEKNGYKAVIHTAPQSQELLSELAAVSGEWLLENNRTEVIFSQGQFDMENLRSSDIICIENKEGKVVSFLNIIPDYALDECTYDLFRKVTDAPSACMDGLIVKLIEYAKSNDFRYINLGMVPLVGIEKPDNAAEHIMQFVSSNFPKFKKFHNQRDFKDKYCNKWEKRYLLFDHDFDLLHLPAVMKKVMKAMPTS
ncbi:phosphatidylglycerol lysyltransferase domain-containing protein [Sphingobacterium cellulitidis]|uniref:phosphatidylglycerol lysyltransferase domain-containing protein n=1 Tax=Sphingobacterium cellulitidis TaxID=1768011 RepID=UPI00370D2142